MGICQTFQAVQGFLEGRNDVMGNPILACLDITNGRPQYPEGRKREQGWNPGEEVNDGWVNEEGRTFGTIEYQTQLGGFGFK